MTQGQGSQLVIYWHQLYQVSPFKSIAIRTTLSCVFSRFRWNLAECCSSCDVITSWPDLTWPFSHQKLRKRRACLSYGKFQHDTPNGVGYNSEKLRGGGGGCINFPPLLARVNSSPPVGRRKAAIASCITPAAAPTNSVCTCSAKWRMSSLTAAAQPL